jgi:hypothetical protein
VLAGVAEEFGLSREVGAFLAGVSLASTPFREAISSRLTSVRDFLLLFFFVNLGAELELHGVGSQVLPAIVLSVFVLVGNPLIVVAIMGWMGYRKRTGFLAGLAVAQISEFSLILATLGMTVGHIDRDTVSLVTLVGLVTIGGSTYMILYSHQLYARLAPWLTVFERRVPHPEDVEGDLPAEVDVIVFGLGRYGRAIADGLRASGDVVMGIDFDPETVREWKRRNLPVHYGDAEDTTLMHALPIHRTRCIISTVPEPSANLALLRALEQEGYSGTIALTARSETDAHILAAAGATTVLRPFADAATLAVEELRAHRHAGRTPTGGAHDLASSPSGAPGRAV